MSERHDNLSKAQSALLFVHLGQSTQSGQTGRHRHAFWQLEIGLEGEVELWTRRYRQSLTAGTQLLIPPGTAHGFSYSSAQTRWVTYKFSLAETGDALADKGPWLYHEHPTLTPLFHALATLAPAAARCAPRETRLALSLLEAVCNYARSETPEASPPSDQRQLRARVDAVLQEAAGRPTTISEIARAVGLSPGHLSNRFSKEHGVPLKQHVDEVRLSFVLELLMHADLPISLIADELQFPDVYSFSRFVKRISGRTPREIRADAP